MKFKRGVIGILTVGSRGHGQALRADLEWENLASDDPSDWSPGGGKEENEDTDERDRRLLRSDVLDDRHTSISLAQGRRTKNGDEKLRDGHADGTPEEERTSTPLVDGVETWKGGCNVDS